MLKKWGRAILSPTFTLSKRQVGILLSFWGFISGIGTLIYDAIRENNDFGTTQQAIVALSFGAILLGLTMIPLGDESA